MDKLNADRLLESMQRAIEQSQGKINGNIDEENGFGKVFTSAIEKVNTLQLEAGDLAKKFEQGDPNVELADVMIALQKASVGFEAVLQVRNRLVTAYQEIMNMPI